VLDGAIYCTRAVIESMVKNKYGRIVFFTGEGAFMGGSGRAAVSAAKMGLVGLARGLASEFAAQNIRVNVVSPGSIDTSRTNPSGIRAHAERRRHPARPQGTVDEIAATCLFPGDRRRRLHHRPDDPRQRRCRVLLIDGVRV
jgi:NAD(P)-dependent dehydrogenase (short-subunit alcohol dehydrogenase family)